MKWLTEDIATGPYNEINQNALPADTVLVDVRDLVDKAGNDIQYINVKIDESLSLLQKGKKIIICCDYGMSRSNSIAIGVMTKWLKLTFPEAVSIAKKVVDESGIKIEMLNTVYNSLFGTTIDHNSIEKPIKNICITGANGFFGKDLVRKLRSNFNVFHPSSKEINLIENVVELDMLIKSNQIDCIVHLANPTVYTNTKAIGETIVMLKNVLDVCRTNNVKIIYLSSWEVYSGYRSEKLMANEVLPANPRGTYGETKWLCELLVKQYAATYDIKYQIIRSSPVFGPGSEKPKFIYNFIAKALKNQKIATHTYLNGDSRLDLLYIDDVVAFLGKAVTSNFVGDLNIGSGTTVSTFEIAQMILEITGSKSKIVKVPILDYSANIVMDYSRAKNVFSWSPTIKVKEGLLKILKNYQQ